MFGGKSIGTIVAAKLASSAAAKDRIRPVLYTPLEDTFSFDFGEAIVFSGTDDPWVGGKNSRIAELAANRGYQCILIPEANHSLESSSIDRDIANLKMIMEETTRFLAAATDDNAADSIRDK